jgi:hypothetical protein
LTWKQLSSDDVSLTTVTFYDQILKGLRDELGFGTFGGFFTSVGMGIVRNLETK